MHHIESTVFENRWQVDLHLMLKLSPLNELSDRVVTYQAKQH